MVCFCLKRRPGGRKREKNPLGVVFFKGFGDLMLGVNGFVAILIHIMNNVNPSFPASDIVTVGHHFNANNKTLE